MSPSISVIDVGHGNSTVVLDREIVIIDAGRGSGLLEFLTANSLYKIKLVLISHSDADHIGGLIGVLGSDLFKIERVILNSDASKNTELWNDLLTELDDQRRKGEIQFNIGITTGDTETCGEILIETMAPTPYLAAKGPGSRDKQDRKIKTNSSSAVFRLVHNDLPILICGGDIDGIGLDEMLEEEIEADAPILIFPHHGGIPHHSTPEDFVKKLCDKVKPRTVIFSIGRGKFENPNPKIINALRAAVPELRIACTQLSKHCAANADRTNLATHLANHPAAGDSMGRCCAGTVVIDLRDNITIMPKASEHADFIELHTETALCKTSE